MSEGKLTYSDIIDEDGKKIPSKHAQYLRQLLKDEYGIETEEQLDEAIEENRQELLSLRTDDNPANREAS
ncbi:MAG: hypothetical protein AWU54_2254 [Candidatus Frackibacter sp. T328-2]|nr:MAG: hypothetical protein AWU54_2254 [Candidatus Frackibacter sp. T328-2]